MGPSFKRNGLVKRNRASLWTLFEDTSNDEETQKARIARLEQKLLQNVIKGDQHPLELDYAAFLSARTSLKTVKPEGRIS